MALCFVQSIMTPGRREKKKKKEQNGSGMREGGRTGVCGGENDKDRKNELGKQERLRVQKETAGRRGFLVSKQQQAGRREATGDVVANHFPSNRVRNSSLMQRHQGNRWCGADMLLCLDMLV